MYTVHVAHVTRPCHLLFDVCRYGGRSGWIFRHLALAKSGCYENAPIIPESEQAKFPVRSTTTVVCM